MKLADADPADVCAALAPLLLDERRARIEELLDARLGGLRVVIENLHDPHNGAAVLRSCEAFGLQFVHVVEAAERFRFSEAVTQGAQKWLDVVRHETFAACAAQLTAGGFRLYAAVPDATATLADIDFNVPAAIVIGNEHAGLSAEAIGLAHERIAIPMFGMTRSLNLSVATAVLVEQAAAARRRAIGRPGDLDEPTRLALRARFYALDVRGAAAIVARHRAGKRL